MSLPVPFARHRRELETGAEGCSLAAMPLGAPGDTRGCRYMVGRRRLISAA